MVAKFPWSCLSRTGNSVKIQQDGAKSHTEDDDEEWLLAVEEMGVNVKLHTQPAQSPDLNINNLAFFRSVMLLKRRDAPKDSLELIACVQKTYDECPANEINRMWLTLMSCMNEIINNDGGNDDEIPHMGTNSKGRDDFQVCWLQPKKQTNVCEANAHPYQLAMKTIS